MMAERTAHYYVTIVVDYGSLSTVVCVPRVAGSIPVRDTIPTECRDRTRERGN